jgi:hypothetical protein
LPTAAPAALQGEGAPAGAVGRVGPRSGARIAAALAVAVVLGAVALTRARKEEPEGPSELRATAPPHARLVEAPPASVEHQVAVNDSPGSSVPSKPVEVAPRPNPARPGTPEASRGSSRPKAPPTSPVPAPHPRPSGWRAALATLELEPSPAGLEKLRADLASAVATLPAERRERLEAQLERAHRVPPAAQVEVLKRVVDALEADRP